MYYEIVFHNNYSVWAMPSSVNPVLSIYAYFSRCWLKFLKMRLKIYLDELILQRNYLTLA